MEKQTWLVTGGSSEVAEALFDELNDRLNDSIDVYAQYYSNSIEKKWDRIDIHPICADLSKPTDVDRLIGEVTKDDRVITHIIHLAAVPYESVRIKEWDSDRVERQMQVGLYSFAKICKALVPGMAKRKDGQIVVMLTEALKDETVPSSICEYISVKSALEGYSKALMAEYASKNISVHLFYPAMMETRFLKNINPRIIELDAEKRPGGKHMTTNALAKEILDKLVQR